MSVIWSAMARRDSTMVVVTSKFFNNWKKFSASARSRYGFRRMRSCRSWTIDSEAPLISILCRVLRLFADF
jgi:hypothetical protein